VGILADSAAKSSLECGCAGWHQTIPANVRHAERGKIRNARSNFLSCFVRERPYFARRKAVALRSVAAYIPCESFLKVWVALGGLKQTEGQ
jgi:hypothetical protein